MLESGADGVEQHLLNCPLDTISPCERGLAPTFKLFEGLVAGANRFEVLWTVSIEIFEVEVEVKVKTHS
jgi:hypothetical protein